MTNIVPKKSIATNKVKTTYVLSEGHWCKNLKQEVEQFFLIVIFSKRNKTLLNVKEGVIF
jgi:hypothetical protein